MNTSQAATAYAALYGPTSTDLVHQLPDVADGLSSRLHTLAMAATPELADQIARDASGLTALAMKIATLLRRERDGQ